MKPHHIHPIPVYPIGEFLDGSRLCASVASGREVDWFPEHRDFDCEDLVALDSSDFIVDDAAPTLKDAVPLCYDDEDWN